MVLVVHLKDRQFNVLLCHSSYVHKSFYYQEFEDLPARNGVYCQILGEQVEVVGEKGTKVGDSQDDRRVAGMSYRGIRVLEL